MEYLALREVLLRLGTEGGASECHGILCGLLCAQGGQRLGNGWLTRVLEAGDGYAGVNEADLQQGDLEMLASLYRETEQQFLELDFTFAPLLPDDDSDLSERIQALAEWCRGFLYGIAAGGLDVSSNYSSEVGELLHDLTEISRAEIYEEQGEEEDERACMELVEYIRLGVIFIYEELQGRRNLPADAEPPVLH